MYLQSVDPRTRARSRNDSTPEQPGRGRMSTSIWLAAATFLAMAGLVAPATATDRSSFEVRMLPKSYVTFEVGHHPPRHERYGYFPRRAWHEVKHCRLRATHRGNWVRVELGNHRLTNPHPFRVQVRCRPGS